MPEIDTLVQDIYDYLMEPQEISKENLDTLAQDIRDSVEGFFSRGSGNNFKLRISNIGQPDRYLWLQSRHPEASELTPHDKLRFFFGVLWEPIILFLVREAGHNVTDVQKKVSIGGLTGYMDCRIDGVPVDVKSASNNSFRDKFDRENLTHAGADHYGYIHQISSYTQATHDEDQEGAFLAVNKVSGELALLKIHPLEMPNIEHRIEEIQEILESDEMPPRCYEPKPQKNGNETLPGPCIFCPFKVTCWGETLRVFRYSNGPKFFTHVEAKPRVEEITDEWKALQRSFED